VSQHAFDWGPEPVGDDTYSVSALNAAVESVIRRTFSDEVWVRGEVRGIKVSPAGHAYFSLVERTDDGEQTLQVSLFRRARLAVTQYLARQRMQLADGIEVRVCGQVEYYAARGQVSLRMTGIDPTYTLGRMAADRDALLRRLAATGMLDANKARVMARVPLRVGLVTSVGSAAYHDFVHELSASGFAWRVLQCDARVQGIEAPAQLRASITTLNRCALDVICVVRGGGSRTDLVAFETESVALAIAAAKVPVVVGVGHEVDSSVADLVAHTSVKTPTACAQLLVTRVREFSDELAAATERLRDASLHQLARSDVRVSEHRTRVVRAGLDALRHGERDLATLVTRTTMASRTQQDRAAATLDVAHERLRRRVPRWLNEQSARLDGLEPRIRALDPALMLARGWSITHTVDGALVRRMTDAPPGRVLVTTLASGEVRSVVADAMLAEPTELNAMPSNAMSPDPVGGPQ
jgi:exodeoxyribonuclease VII large subunit